MTESTNSIKRGTTIAFAIKLTKYCELVNFCIVSCYIITNC